MSLCQPVAFRTVKNSTAELWTHCNYFISFSVFTLLIHVNDSDFGFPFFVPVLNKHSHIRDSTGYENLVFALFLFGFWPATLPFQLRPHRHRQVTCESLELPVHADCSPLVFTLLPIASSPLSPCARWLDSRCHGNKSCKKLNNIWMEGRGERGEGSGLSCSNCSKHNVVFLEI